MTKQSPCHTVQTYHEKKKKYYRFHKKDVKKKETQKIVRFLSC